MSKSIRERYDELTPIRRTVATIENDCTVITYSELVHDALNFYKGKATSFFILDKLTSELENIDIDDCVVYGKDAFEKMLIHEKRYCYVKPSWMFWERHGLWPFSFEIESYKKDFSYNIPTQIIDPLRSSFSYRSNGDPQYIEGRFQDIEKVYTSLADDESKKCYLGMIKALATGDPGYVSLSTYLQYRHPNCLPEVGDTVIDGGLETAFTPIMFSDLVKELGEVIGFEPVPQHAANCRNSVSDRDNITIVEQGLSSRKGHFFIHGSGASSFLSHEAIDGAIECTTTDIDSWCIENGKCPSLYKLDIEGSEQSAIRGSKFILENFQPKIMISLYHRIEDYIDIPLFFINHYPEYSLYIGHHSPWWNETILYGQPKNRIASRRCAANQISTIERNHTAMLMDTVFDKLEALETRSKEISEIQLQANEIMKSLVSLLSANNEISKETYTCLLSTEYEHMPFYRFLRRKLKKIILCR